LKKITDIKSAADKQDDGWPEPASVVAFSESIRRRLPFSLSESMDVGIFYILYRWIKAGSRKRRRLFY
jgi:hypothetical protein